MIEFYYKYHKNGFKKKSIQLANEITSILAAEEIVTLSTHKENISLEYRKQLGKELFDTLNNLYFTIRKNDGKNHSHLKKYLPELKQEPHSQMLFADFFSGAGGLSQGLINAGFQPAFVNDNYIEALETYYFNHNLILSRFYHGDIKQLVDNIEDYVHLFKNVKIIAGGPPCQGFSTANRWNFERDLHTQEKRFIEDDRNVLYKYFVKMLGLIKPDYFIMENVRGMRKVEDQIEEDIKNETHQQYFFSPFVLDAQKFNIPQNRSRYILIGGKDVFKIEQIKTNLIRRNIHESKYKLRDALYGLPIIGTNPVKLKPEYDNETHGFTIRKFKTKQNDFLHEINQNKEIYYLLNHKSRYNNENDLEIFKLLPEGENSLHESIQSLNKYHNRKDIFKDKYYKLKLNEVSKTITSHMKYDCHMYIHPEQARGLSPREAARLQTFPDDYLFRGTLNDWYKQIGNAVPVKLAEIIANELMNFYK